MIAYREIKMSYEHELIDLINDSQRAAKLQPLNLGGISGPGGGSGGPSGGIVGLLPQKYVAYDETEASSNEIPVSGNLIDNLNHIRYEIDNIIVSGVGNLFYIDQAGGASDTYGILSGTRDGNNIEFTVSQEEYVSGTLSAYLNGQLLTQGSGEDWHEVDPTLGTFHFAVAPEATDELTAMYGYLGLNGGGIGEAPIDSTPYSRQDAGWVAANVNAGDVIGPAVAISGNFVNFDGITGKHIIDSGAKMTDFALDAHNHDVFYAPINLQNHGQLIWTIEGANLTAAQQGVKPLKLRLPYVGAGGTIEEVYGQLGTAPNGANIRVDIHKNGTSIFTATNYVEIAIGNTTVSKTNDLAGSGAIAKDDYFQIELVQGDVVAADLVIHMRYYWILTTL